MSKHLNKWYPADSKINDPVKSIQGYCLGDQMYSVDSSFCGQSDPRLAKLYKANEFWGNPPTKNDSLNLKCCNTDVFTNCIPTTYGTYRDNCDNGSSSLLKPTSNFCYYDGGSNNPPDLESLHINQMTEDIDNPENMYVSELFLPIKSYDVNAKTINYSSTGNICLPGRRLYNGNKDSWINTKQMSVNDLQKIMS